LVELCVEFFSADVLKESSSFLSYEYEQIARFWKPSKSVLRQVLRHTEELHFSLGHTLHVSIIGVEFLNFMQYLDITVEMKLVLLLKMFITVHMANISKLLWVLQHEVVIIWVFDRDQSTICNAMMRMIDIFDNWGIIAIVVEEVMLSAMLYASFVVGLA
jgi:hypothetical protein